MKNPDCVVYNYTYEEIMELFRNIIEEMTEIKDFNFSFNIDEETGFVATAIDETSLSEEEYEVFCDAGLSPDEWFLATENILFHWFKTTEAVFYVDIVDFKNCNNIKDISYPISIPYNVFKNYVEA